MSIPKPKPTTACLITGASSGIGEQLARGLARRGHNLVLVARREQRLREIAEEIGRTTGVEALALACDLGDADARRVLVEQVEAAGRDVEVLGNCAGLGSGGRFLDLDADDEQRVIRVNTEALVHLCSVYGGPMARRGAGAILNVASIAGFAPIPRQATYAATKAFVISFSHAMQVELKRVGVTVTTLCPGPTNTEFGAASGPQVADVMRKRLPGFMTTDAEEVAEAGLRALERGQRQLIVGAVNKVSAMSAYFTPRSLELAMMDRFYPVKG